MKIDITQLSLLEFFLGISVMNGLRYLIFSGGMFLLFWGVLSNRLRNRRIQKKAIKLSQVLRETGYSFSSIFILGLSATFLTWYRRSGMPTLIEGNAIDAGWFIPAVTFLLIVLHDTYFYFAHRLMHHRKLYRLTHIVHHRSLQPTPLAAFTFQPTEAVLQALFVLVVNILYPVPIASLAAFLFYSLIMNILGHLGYEILPSGFTRSRWTMWSNTPTHHAMHHRYVHCNYSLYFNWWDRILGTNHEHYHDAFEAVVAGVGLEEFDNRSARAVNETRIERRSIVDALNTSQNRTGSGYL